MRYLLFLFAAPFLLALEEEEDFTENLNLTHHEILLESGPLAYTAMTGMCPIYEDEEVQAELFFIAYQKDDKEDRPITFVFPGGPGGAGTLESILPFGPRRLLTPYEGRTILPPFQIIDNPETLLEYTDLVFVDPVNCGFSRVTEEGDLPYYQSVEGDIEALSEFIYTCIDRSNRWNSSIYLSGGSYGTLRCCGIARNLLQYGIATAGIILDGCAFEFNPIVSLRDQFLPDCLLIPTFAATAWYHKKLWPDQPLEEVIDYARRFAYEAYAPFMLDPTKFSAIEREAFVKETAELIGLPVETLRRYNLRINEKIYTQEFFGSERKILGGLDSRYVGDVFTIDPDHSHDPSYLDTLGCTPAFNAYLQKELDTHFPFRKYVAFSSEMFDHWNFRTHDTFGVPSFLQRLRQTLIINPLMKVFIGSGYYDCRTPFAATEYCFNHLDLPESYRKNLHFAYYEAGHGFIFDYPSLKKWKSDLTKFYKKILTPN